MDFTLATLKRCAATAEAELVVLTSGSRIPDPRPGDFRRERWLCILPEADRRLAYAAVSSFDKIFIFSPKRFGR